MNLDEQTTIKRTVTQ